MLAWHFTGERLRDGRLLPKIGETLIHTGELIPCRSGYHASERLIDALHYAPGPHLWRVRLGGKIIPHCGDKLVATERTGLWRIDATDMLQIFARECALDVAHLWEMPAIVHEFLKTGRTHIRHAARAAAWSGAGAAAWVAARAAAWAAAGDAALAAAWAAAGAAAGTAAGAAAWDDGSDLAQAFSWDSARIKQNDRLTKMATEEATRLGYGD